MCWAALNRSRHDPRALTRALLLAFATASATAQDLMPRQPPGREAATVRIGGATGVRGWATDNSPVVIPRLDQLSVTGSEAGRPNVRRDGVLLSGMSVPALEALAAELSEWIGKPLTETGLDRLTEVILRHYDDHDRPMNDVWVPPQSGADGRLDIQVVEGRVGAVALERTGRFNDSVIRQGLHLREGDLLTGAALQTDLDWLSRNPFRRAELFAAPGEGVTADLLVRLDERRPWRVYTGYDNNGTRAVGRNRWFAGLNHGNALGLDHVVGWQMTTGDSLDALHAHALSWEIPLHRLQHFIRLSGAWADASAEESLGGLALGTHGSSWQLSALYGRPLPRIGGWRQEVRGGIEFKRTDNFIVFGETALPQAEVDVVQFRGEWQGNGPLWGGQAEVRFDGVASPGDLTGRNGSDEFGAFRADADPSYAYARIEGSWLRPLAADWSCLTRATAQRATGALLPTEQLGLGGSSNVRGYPERMLLADTGYAVSAELRTPAHRPTPAISIQALLFLDHGRGWREGEGSDTLTGLGAGLRLRLGETASARLDIGWPLENGRGPEVHAGATFSF